MPLVFLVPALLAGLAAIGIPVLLHLRRRERERPMRFPSLMFLQRVRIATARRRRVTDWPLLLLRALIVALAVLAFARPVIRPRPDATHDAGARRVVIALDRSLSMGHAAVWPAARDSVRNLINALAPGDRVALLSFDDAAAVEQPLTLDHAAALAALARLAPGSGGTRYGAAIRAARELLLKEADRSGGDVIVVTDLQRTGATGLSGVTLPPDVRLRAVNAAPGKHGNSSVTGITVQRLAGQGDARARLVVAAQVAARGLAAPRQVHVTMLVGGREAGSRDLLLPADGNATVHFDAVPLPVSGARVVVALAHDSLAADDSFRVMVPAQAVRRVVLVTPADADAGETFYLERALQTGDDPAFRIERHNAAALDPTTLRDAAAVMLYDVAPPAGAAGTSLAAWVHDGGGLITVAGRRTSARPPSAGYLPGTLHGLVDRTGDRGGSIGVTSLEHPVFAPFRGATAPLGAARFFRYARVTPSTDAQVLARFDDGNPALVERQEGRGRVLLVAVPLDATSGDFPVQPTFLPFLRALTLHAAGDAVVPFFRTVGDGWSFPATVRNPLVQAPSGKVIRPELSRLPTAFALDDAGFYSLYDNRASGDPVATVAVDPVAAESDLTQMPATDMLVGIGQDSVTSKALASASLSDAERRQQLWRTFLLLGALALLVEMLVASRGWRGTAAKVVGAAVEGGQG